MLPRMRSPQRPRRADARRNRNAILAAARVVFAERGLDAPLDAIARAANVSRATQHRHFPTRESLVRAIFDDNLETLARIVEDADDPADAYVELLLTTVDMLVRDRSFVELLEQRAVPDEIRQDIADRFLTVVTEPLRRAQQAGRIRNDLRPDDTMLLLDMLGAAAHPPGPARPADRVARGISLVLEAIGPNGPRQPLGR